jgi:hypothetical protein
MAEIRQSPTATTAVAEQAAEEFSRIFDIQWTTFSPDITMQGNREDHLTSTSPLHT